VPCSDILAHYELWLAGTPLADRTRTNYRRWVAELVEDLAAGEELAAFLSPAGEHERRALLTDWRRRLVDRGLAPATINLALAAATSLLDSRALASPRDRAILQVLVRTGLRIGEVAALDRSAIQITQRTGQLVVRHGKGDHYRVVPLSRSARQALNTWLPERAKHAARRRDRGSAVAVAHRRAPLRALAQRDRRRRRGQRRYR
jgi:integrase